MACDFKILNVNEYFSKTLSATSEDAEFPVTNLDKVSRSYVWRSDSEGGHFYITTSNQKIDFDEGGGALVATVSTGTYSASTLATEIKTQLEAVGGDTYTITYDATTGKWTLASDGGTLSFLWDTGGNKASSIAGTIGFDDSADDTGSTTYTSDNIAIHTEERVVLDLTASPVDIDSFGAFFDLVGPLKSPTATYRLKANATDTEAGWASPSVNIALTLDTDDKTISHFFSSAEIYRYWAVEIVDPTNTYLYVELDSLWLGEALTLSQKPETGFKDVILDQSKKRTNSFGYEYWDEYPQRKELRLKWKVLDNTDKDVLRGVFKTNGFIDPVFIAFDTDETIFPDREQLMIYGRITNKWDAKQVYLTFYDYKMNVREVV